MNTPPKSSGQWVSDFATVCDAVGLLAVRLARSAALVIGALAAHEAVGRLESVPWLLLFG